MLGILGGSSFWMLACPLPCGGSQFTLTIFTLTLRLSAFICIQLWALPTPAHSFCPDISCRFSYLPSPSLVFLFLFSKSLFSIWNLFCSLYRSIDPLSYRPPASWGPLFTVTRTIIRCGHFWLFQHWLLFSQLMPRPHLIYHHEHLGAPWPFLWPERDSEACNDRQRIVTLPHGETQNFCDVDWEWINRQINKMFSWCRKERKKAYNFRFGQQQFSGACLLWGLWWMVLHSTLHPDLHAVKFSKAISNQRNCHLKCRVITERCNTW